MNIAEIIAGIIGGKNPNEAILNANGAIPPSGMQQQAPPTPPMPIPDATPTGVKSPVTNPTPTSEVPKAMQSPPDLANMYVELMRKNQNAAALDSGITTIAAGFSKYPENRAALLAAAGRGGTGAGGGSLTSADLINLQKQDQANRDRLIRQQALPALMKQYKMSEAQIRLLDSSGKLDEVLQNFATRSLSQVKDDNGQTHLIDDRAEGGKGKIIATIGSQKEDPTQLVDTPAGKKPMNMLTGETIGPGAGIPPDKEIVELPDGRKVMVDKVATPAGTEIAPARKPGDAIDPLENQLAAINKENAATGKPLMTMPELIKLKQYPTTQVNVGKENYPHVKPEAGQDYRRNPDGTIKYNADGEPELYNIKGGDQAVKAVETQRKMDEEAKKEAKRKFNEEFSSSNVGRAVDKAFGVVDKFGASGVGSKLVRNLPIGGMSWDTLDAAVNTINANVAFRQLQQMREAAATGSSGLGQVTEKENQMLASVIEDLRAYQDTDQLKTGLARTKAAMYLLAHNDFKTQADFDKALGKMSEEILAEQFNKTSKVKVTPR
jgi:hypothetical protein